MADMAFQIIKVARPVHWVKNLALFAALIFGEQLTNQAAAVKIFWAFWAFNFATSAIYIINDIADASSDRMHPVKKNRPIASGKLSVNAAVVEAILLAFLSFVIASALSNLLVLVIIVYFLLQISYSYWLKRISVVDILIIASGFILRVYAGAFIIDAHLSVWFLLCVISVALFLASGKRRAELSLVTPGITRKSLTHYPRELLNSYVTMFGNAAWMSWALFTFFESPKATKPVWLLLAEFSKTTTIDKLLMITIPVVIFGIMRYQKLIFDERTEAPEKLLLTDSPLVISVFLWVAMVISIIYGGLSV